MYLIWANTTCVLCVHTCMHACGNQKVKQVMREIIGSVFVVCNGNLFWHLSFIKHSE
jgi:hypothetical protein